MYRGKTLKRNNKKYSNTLSSNEEKYIIEKSKQNRNRIIFLLTITLYALLIALGTTDEDIFLLNPIQIPLIKTTLPLISFYNFMPIFILFIHLNVIYMIRKNKKEISRIPSYLPGTILDHIYNVNTTFLGVFIGFLVYILPLGTLAFILYRFSDYQNIVCTSFHLLWLFLDVLLLLKIKSLWIKLVSWWIFICAIIYSSLMFNFLINGASSFINKNYLPRLEITNTNLNKNINIGLLRAYSKEGNIDNPLSIIPLVNMQGRRFINADFSHSVMYRFDFTNATLSYSKFNNTRMQYTVFKNTIMRNINFKNTDLSKSTFEDVNASGIDFIYTDLTQSIIKRIDFSDSFFDKVDFSGSFIKEVDFLKSSFNNSKFIASFLNIVDFRASIIMFTDFSASQFSFVNFKLAHLNSCDFIGVNASHINLNGVYFFNVNMIGLNNYNKVMEDLYKYSFKNMISGKIGQFTLQKKINSTTNFDRVFVVNRNSKYVKDTYDKLYKSNSQYVTTSDLDYLKQFLIFKNRANKGINRIPKKLPYIHNFANETLNYYKNAIGKNNKEWIEINKKNIIKGKISKNHYKIIIKRIKHNRQALKFINFREEDEVIQ